jgi:maleylpyruvate isomerase
MNPGPPARQVHAATLVWMRLREVEVHHGDFAADYTFAHTPAALATRLIDEAVNRLSPQMAASVELVTPNGTWRLGGADSPQIVHGSTGSSVAWLLGRSTGGLESASPLPTLPPWG